MAEEVESLVLEASVIDDFSRTLDELSQELLEVEGEAEAVDPIEMGARVGEAMAKLEALQGQAVRTGMTDAEIDANVDHSEFDNAAVSISGLHNKLNRLKQEEADPEADLDAGQLWTKIQALNEQIESLDREDLDIDVDAEVSDAMTKLQGASAQLRVMDREEVDVDVDAHIADVMAKLAAVEATLEGIDDMDIDIDIDTDKRARAAMERVREQEAMGHRDLPGMQSGAHEFGEGVRRGFDDDFDIDARARTAIAREKRDVDFDIDPDIPLGLPSGIHSFGEGGLRDGDDDTLRDVIRKFSRLNVSMGMFMNIFASIIPLLAVFVGALPAAIAGLGALAAASFAAAGAMAGVVGLGLGAMMFEDGELNVREAQEQLRTVLDEALEAFRPLMEALRPVAEALFRNIQIAVRDLATHMTPLVDLTDEVIASFRWMASVVGPAMEDFIRLGEAAAPVMEAIVSGIAEIEWFEIFADVLAQTLPKLQKLAAFLMSLAPAIFEISKGFLTATNVIMGLFNAFVQLITFLPFSGEVIGGVVSWFLVAVTASALWSRATGALMTKIMTLAVQALPSLFGPISSYIAGMFGARAATLATAGAALTLMSILTLGLAPVLSSIMGSFFGMGESIGHATDKLEDFDKMGNRVSDPSLSDGSGAGRGAGYGPPGAGTTIIAPDKETGNAVANTVNWQNNGSATTDQSDVNNRQHSK